MRWTWLLMVAGMGLAANAQTLTPREIFYSERLNTTQANRPASGAKRPAAAKKQDRKAEVPEVASTPTNTTVRPVDYRTRPLGLRYSLLRQGSSGAFAEADPKGEFISGDRVRLAIESSDPAYLYVISQGSSGNWTVLYPGPGADATANRVVPGMRYEVPANNQAFSFNDQPGEERLFVILSRKAEADLEKLIPSLSRQTPVTSPNAPKPAAKGETSILAENVPIKNELVDRFRTYSRDLIVETVTPEAPAAQARPKPAEAAADERAVYVVNPKAAEDGRVVADIRLIHR